MDRPVLAPGMRRTRQRQAIWQAMKELGGHRTADEIAAQVKQTDPGVARSTVYRALEAMSRSGEVVGVHLGGRGLHYELAPDPHHHAICLLCGRVTHIDPSVVRAVEGELRRAGSFQPMQVELTVTGLCDDCSREPDAAARLAVALEKRHQ